MADTEQSGQSGRAPQARPARSAYRPLGLIVIIAILVAATSTGFYFKSEADPGTEPSSFSGHPPQYLNLYVTDQSLKVKVTVTLGQGFFNSNYDRYGPVTLRSQGYTDFQEKIDFSATRTGNGPPGAIIIASSTRPLGAAHDSIYGSASTPGTVSVLQLKDANGALGKADKFAVWFTLSPGAGNSWSGTAFFGPVPVIYQDKGSTFGHLPSVGAYSYLYPPSPVLAGEYDARTDQPSAVSLGSFAKIPAGEREEDFYAPNFQASYSEDVQQIVPALGNTQTAYMNPSTDAANDADYEWQANNIDGLEPIFKAVDLGAGDAQSQAAFYSGIAFGVAGSALIAIAQEIPRQRRARNERASGNQRQRVRPE